VVLDLGGVRESHNGPPESYRVGGNGTQTNGTIAWRH
jgi:hypothetical protein